jgi:hypothetical protein
VRLKLEPTKEKEKERSDFKFQGMSQELEPGNLEAAV